VITVITVCKDDAIGLELTTKSLLSQTARNWKQIIVYGESADSTELVAKELSLNDERIQCIKEDKRGIYQAMNQGLARCNSDFVWFMNSSDVFYSPTALERASNLIREKNATLVIGGYKVRNGTKAYFLSNEIRECSAREISLSRRGTCHQSMLFRTEKLVQIGGYDEKLEIVADFDAVMQLALREGGVFSDSDIYSEILPGGGADKAIKFVVRARYDVRKRYFDSPVYNFRSWLLKQLILFKINTREFVKNRTRKFSL